VLIAAAVRSVPGHEEALRLMKAVSARGLPWCLAWPNVYEFLRVVTHRGVFKRPLRWDAASAFVADLLQGTDVEVIRETASHFDVLCDLVRRAGGAAGNFVHDCHVAAVMRENGITRIVTRDSHFRRFDVFDVRTPAEMLDTLGL
jgi:toxin-antitoxin system PIN domain toxin